ncbi:MAG TPA: GNAT family N-acetyltransferase [Bryobacteraceae bacterium]
MARRIETAEAAHVVASAEVLKPLRADTLAQPFAGGVALFAGVQSALTHAVGIGLNGTVPETDLAQMEEFFRLHGSPCVIDLCPLADISILAYLQRHPYRLADFNNVMARNITPNESFAAREAIREIHESERNEWARVICGGFSAQMPVEEEAVALIAATSKVSRCWLAVENTPVAGAAMGEHNGVALLYGDATIPQARRRGWQSALIAARLAAAQKLGCDLAAASVLPGSSSHRNYERAGFQLLYMRVNLTNEGT